MRAAQLGKTPYEILIIASMIEREAKFDDDRAEDRPGDLQPPVPRHAAADRRHAVLRAGSRTRRSATSRRIDTPYNTYLHAGLPPTPIANPGRASIEAALNPAPNPGQGDPICAGLPAEQCLYLYYVKIDKDGHHAFSATLAQQEANIVAGAGQRRQRVITGRTRLAAVIGHPVEHSLSPALHNAGFASLGLDWVYVAFDVAAGGGRRRARRRCARSASAGCR